jgi:hypothetical protein
MMQPGRSHPADVHAGALPDGLQPFKYGYVFCGVGHWFYRVPRGSAGFCKVRGSSGSFRSRFLLMVAQFLRRSSDAAVVTPATCDEAHAALVCFCVGISIIPRRHALCCGVMDGGSTAVSRISSSGSCRFASAIESTHSSSPGRFRATSSFAIRFAIHVHPRRGTLRKAFCASIHRSSHFMNIARSSLGETQNHLLHAKERKYVNEKDFEELWRLTCRALKAANRLHAYLREQSQKNAARKEPKAPKGTEAPQEPQEP